MFLNVYAPKAPFEHPNPRRSSSLRAGLGGTGDYLDTVVRDGTHTATATDQGEDEDEGKSQDNSSHDRDQVDGKPLLYLKDWHFQRLRGERGAAVAAKLETAFFFADDWLNWWWVLTCSAE